jgi:AraC-like DNA-binding protein
MYREFAVSGRLHEVVEAVWVREPASATDRAPAPATDADTPGTDRVLPDGCTDLIWVDGELLVAGPDTHAHLSTARPRSTYAAVRFAPGAGPALFGVPGHELRDGRIPLSALWPEQRARRLADLVTTAADRPRALLEIVTDRLADTPPPDPVVAAIARNQGLGRSVVATADALHLSERQLHRTSLHAFGYGPKTLARILRLRRAVAMARGRVPFAEVAVRARYADQAHLAREVRALAGLPLGQLLN